MINENAKLEKVIDIELSMKVMGCGLDTSKNIIRMFVNSLPERRKKIEEANESLDYKKLSRVAYKLYDTSSYCGVPVLESIAKELSIITSDKECEEKKIFELVNKVCKEIDAVIYDYENNVELKDLLKLPRI